MAGRKTQRQKAAARKKRLFLLALIPAIAIFLFCTASLIRYGLRARNTAAINRELAEIHQSTSVIAEETPLTPVPTYMPEPDAAPEPATIPVYQTIGEMLPDAKKLYDLNPDFVAWLNIPGIINLPVVYRDNDYYLTHDFYNKKSDAGTIFLDVNHPLRAETQYLLLHGHAMYDGSMFGYISHYRKMDFIKEHPYLTLNTLYASDYYEIIGSLYLTEEEMVSVAGLIQPCFEDEFAFNDFIDGLRAHALHFTNEEISPDTPLLALSTCFRDGRIVAVFKRIDSQGH